MRGEATGDDTSQVRGRRLLASPLALAAIDHAEGAAGRHCRHQGWPPPPAAFPAGRVVHEGKGAFEGGCEGVLIRRRVNGKASHPATFLRC